MVVERARRMGEHSRGSQAWCAAMLTDLLDALAALAQQADQQLAAHQGCALVCEELALAYVHACWTAPELHRAGWVNGQQRRLVEGLRQRLDAIGDPWTPDRARLWTVAGLRADPRWEAIRADAGEALAAFDPLDPAG